MFFKISFRLTRKALRTIVGSLCLYITFSSRLEIGTAVACCPHWISWESAQFPWWTLSNTEER